MPSSLSSPRLTTPNIKKTVSLYRLLLPYLARANNLLLFLQMITKALLPHMCGALSNTFDTRISAPQSFNAGLTSNLFYYVHYQYMVGDFGSHSLLIYSKLLLSCSSYLMPPFYPPARTHLKSQHFIWRSCVFSS